MSQTPSPQREYNKARFVCQGRVGEPYIGGLEDAARRIEATSSRSLALPGNASFGGVAEAHLFQPEKGRVPALRPMDMRGEDEIQVP